MSAPMLLAAALAPMSMLARYALLLMRHDAHAAMMLRC